MAEQKAEQNNFNSLNKINVIFNKIPILNKNKYKLDKYLNSDILFNIKNEPNLIAKMVNKHELVYSYIAGNKPDYNIGAFIIGYYQESDDKYIMIMEKINGTILKNIKNRNDYRDKIENTLRDLIYNCKINNTDFHSENIIIDENDNVRIIDYDSELTHFVTDESDKEELIKANMYRIYRIDKYLPNYLIQIRKNQEKRLQEKLNRYKTKSNSKSKSKGGGNKKKETIKKSKITKHNKINKKNRKSRKGKNSRKKI